LLKMGLVMARPSLCRDNESSTAEENVR